MSELTYKDLTDKQKEFLKHNEIVFKGVVQNSVYMIDFINCIFDHFGPHETKPNYVKVKKIHGQPEPVKTRVFFKEGDLWFRDRITKKITGFRFSDLNL